MSSKMPPAASSPKKTASRGLGRGLSSLLGDSGIATATGATAASSDAAGAPAATGFQDVPIEWINVGPWQPRRRFDKAGLDELASSIRQKGIVQPVLLRPTPNKPSRYQLVAGERRWRAAQLAKIHQGPAIIRELTDAECYEIALIENIQRSDLSVIEESQGYQKLLETNRYTQDQLSDIIGKSRSHIANLLRLLNLPDEILTYLREGQLTTGHARALITSDDQLDLARQVVKKGLSVRETERLVKRAAQADGLKDKPKPKARNLVEKDADTRALEADLSVGLGMKVLVSHIDGTETGTISITYSDLDQLDDICRILSATQQVESK